MRFLDPSMASSEPKEILVCQYFLQKASLLVLFVYFSSVCFLFKELFFKTDLKPSGDLNTGK